MNGEEAANLLKEQLKFTLAKAVTVVVQCCAFKPPPLIHQFIQELQTLLTRHLLSQIAAEEIKNPIRRELEQILLDLLTLIRELAHPLKQLQAIGQQARCRFITTAFLILSGGIATSKSGQQGEISLAVAAKGRSLRGL